MADKKTTLQAIYAIWDKLPDLLGEEWDDFEGRLLILMRKLDDPDADRKSVLKDIEDLFESSSAATPYQKAVEEASERKRGVDSGFESPGAPAPPAGSRRFGRYVKVPVFYGTDRKREPGSKVAYSGERGNGQLDLGVAEVSIPDDHRMGEIEKPKWFKLQFRENPEKHVVIHRINELSRDEFVRQSKAGLAEQKGGKKQALIFIHGYNVEFNSALERAAQVAYDLNFAGLTMLYSWPSEGSTKKYTVDENNIIWTRPHLMEYLHMVMTELGAEEVNVIAHSMGNRALVENLADFRPEELPADAAKLNQIVFAAPDVDKDTFVDLAKAFRQKANRFTLYASSKDLALGASEILHKYQRAGDSKPKVLVTEGIDTIDASEVKADFLGHSYYGSSESVISDLYKLILKEKPPGQRGLDECELSGEVYWEFKRG